MPTTSSRHCSHVIWTVSPQVTARGSSGVKPSTTTSWRLFGIVYSAETPARLERQLRDRRPVVAHAVFHIGDRGGVAVKTGEVHPGDSVTAPITPQGVLREAGQREHRAVVVGVGVGVEQPDERGRLTRAGARARQSPLEGFDDGGVAAL